jgi:hypothetical protein
MNITSKTENELNIINIEEKAKIALNAISASVVALNNAYNAVWLLPDNQLKNLLQYLYDNNKLQSLLQNHSFAANSLNEILVRGEKIGITAFNTIGRDFAISESGEIKLVIQEQVVAEEIIEDNTIN